MLSPLLLPNIILGEHLCFKPCAASTGFTPGTCCTCPPGGTVLDATVPSPARRPSTSAWPVLPGHRAPPELQVHRHVKIMHRESTLRPWARARCATQGATVPSPARRRSNVAWPVLSGGRVPPLLRHVLIVPWASTPTPPRPRRARPSCRGRERGWRAGGQVAHLPFR